MLTWISTTKNTTKSLLKGLNQNTIIVQSNKKSTKNLSKEEEKALKGKPKPKDFAA